MGNTDNAVQHTMQERKMFENGQLYRKKEKKETNKQTKNKRTCILWDGYIHEVGIVSKRSCILMTKWWFINRVILSGYLWVRKVKKGKEMAKEKKGSVSDRIERSADCLAIYSGNQKITKPYSHIKEELPNSTPSPSNLKLLKLLVWLWHMWVFRKCFFETPTLLVKILLAYLNDILRFNSVLSEVERVLDYRERHVRWLPGAVRS